MDYAFHFVPRAYWEAQDERADYAPEPFTRDGFIHLTDAPGEMANVANRYYGGDPEPYVYIYIDKARVRAPIRYEDPAREYPHIYGRLNRDAIVAVRPARRDAAGKFQPPEILKDQE